MAVQNLGGITMKEVITFQTQVMMGAQFGRIASKQATKEDLLIACLRMGWNDAFRHTSKNKTEGNTIVLETEEIRWRHDGHKKPHDDVICGKILNKPILLNTFVEFACAISTADKVKIVESHYAELEEIFAPYKEITGNKRLCFGHFQKMFNIAIKLYVCLYVCRGWLDLDEGRFCSKILENLQNADCPIDSIILENLASKTNNKEYASHKWSKYGTAKHPQSNYENVQDEISKVVPEGNSRLYYDFVAWKQ